MSPYLLSFSPTFNTYISVQRHTHTHTRTRSQTQVYPCTHTHTYRAFSNCTLLMCEMSKGLISWKHTTEPEEKGREGDTQRESGEKRRRRRRGRKIEKKVGEVSRGEHADDWKYESLLQTPEV